jgi:hypothetical protein
LIVSEQRLTAHGLPMPMGGVDGTGLWRARMLAGAALLIAATLLLVLVLAR